jgi:hypothetical protein
MAGNFLTECTTVSISGLCYIELVCSSFARNKEKQIMKMKFKVTKAVS